jgi:mRNA-degrading endonuclease YafQ of YafQ-DinJ toxin-antitoxin module
MKYALSPEFFAKLKGLDVRVRSKFKEQILVFTKDHNHPSLNSHSLREPYLGFHSINVTNDYRAIYQEKMIANESIAYFIDIGTHPELYGTPGKKPA